MKIRNEGNNVENKKTNNIRSILLDDGHFLFRVKKKSTSSTWSYFDIKNNVGAGLVSAQKGITLIALIITIIIMLILAGVVISLTLGENGLFSTAKYAVAKTKEETAREKLEIALADLQTKKYVDIENYNETTYINNYLINEGMSVEGNIVTVDGYKFEIDRSIPKIKGNTQGQSEIKLTKQVTKYLGKNASDKYEVQALITIESKQEIEKVIIERPDKTTFEITPNEDKKKITKDIEIELDQEYKATIKTKDGKTEEETIIETSNENIKTKEELVAFRDKVNQGLTYEGKTINLVENLNLNNICGENIEGKKVSFEPIGNYGTDNTHIFKGTFNGNYHTIDYLYINTDKDYQGLFGYTDEATIKNLVIGEHSSITGNITVGGIVGHIKSTTIQNCGNSAKIVATGYAGGIVGEGYSSNIIGTYNKGSINGEHHVGGIIGGNEGNNFEDNIIRYSYNTGKLDCDYSAAGICGMGEDYTKIYNCYNTGTIEVDIVKSKGFIGGITGRLRAFGRIKYCYNLGIVNATEGSVGGIVGTSAAYSGSSYVEERASYVENSYNSSNILANTNSTGGGICGSIGQYCKVENSHVLAGITVKDITTKVGSIDGIIGQDSGTSSGNSVLADMPTVYEVVNADENGLNNSDSEYWSKTEYANADLQTPKLKWESNVK